MQFTVAAAALALAAGASAYSNSTGTAGPVYVTEVVTALTTFCPASTTLVHNSKTYTISEATTLTITDCPCTITKAVSSASVPAATWSSAPVYSNGTATTSKPAGAAQGTGSATGSGKPVAYTGAAAANAVSGAAVAAFGLAALIL